eukprot:GEMP01038266.1.p1 GENE.GEMP01038266.1~~GEMP01038266.1.p1  ORF type:complete len:306 (+),score=67.64 GEMP01038266.1:106-1023(+)
MSSFEKGLTNTLRYHEDFTKSQETQEFFLMEIDEMPENEENEENEDPKQDLTIGYFKGTLKEEAVMCTEKKSSYLISQENSNTSFVAKKMDDNAFHIVCDLQDVIILKDSAPRFSTAVELLKKAPLGSDEVVTWDDFHYHVEASDVALYEFVKRPFCVSRAPSEWQWMAPQDQYALSEVMLDEIITKGYTEAVPIDAMMEIARPVLNKIGDVPSLQADVVLQNCLQSDLCDANYHVDFDKVAQFYARALLHETKKMPLELFKRRWQSKLPEMRELDCLKPPLYVFDTDVHYIDELELSTPINGGT